MFYDFEPDNDSAIYISVSCNLLHLISHIDDDVWDTSKHVKI